MRTFELRISGQSIANLDNYYIVDVVEDKIIAEFYFAGEPYINLLGQVTIEEFQRISKLLDSVKEIDLPLSEG